MPEDPVPSEALQRLTRVEVKVDGIDKNLDAMSRAQSDSRREQTASAADQMKAHLTLAAQVAQLSQALAVQNESLKAMAGNMLSISGQMSVVTASVTELKEFRGNVLGRWSIGGAIAAVVGGAAGWAAKHFGG